MNIFQRIIHMLLGCDYVHCHYGSSCRTLRVKTAPNKKKYVNLNSHIFFLNDDLDSGRSVIHGDKIFIRLT